MSGIAGDELDLLVIHVDCSMAHNVGAGRACPPAGDTADALRQVVRADWLQSEADPKTIVLMTPSRSTDAWFYVGNGIALPEDDTEVECSDVIENEFARRRIYRRRGSEIKKPGRVVEGLAQTTAERWESVRAECGEARRFWDDLAAAAPTT